MQKIYYKYTRRRVCYIYNVYKQKDAWFYTQKQTKQNKTWQASLYWKKPALLLFIKQFLFL